MVARARYDLVSSRVVSVTPLEGRVDMGKITIIIVSNVSTSELERLAHSRDWTWAGVSDNKDEGVFIVPSDDE